MGEVWRSGASSSYINQEMRQVGGSAKTASVPTRPWVREGKPHAKAEKIGLVVSATIASKGGGKTTVTCWFDTSEFREVAEAMVRANPVAARAAFESALENPNKTNGEIHRRYLDSELKK
ncbi:hypothetical protein [Bradyrhizobium pachyrhizi]|uniref:hypothetical protein n=1 Tax=Bradyrhizobium pachyrhizi TaxID=280333 RepID=UPI003D35F354